MSNNVKSRIQMKADTAAHWTTAGNNGFIPLKNEAIFYTDKNNMKLGDGVTNINQLDFFIKSGDENGVKWCGRIANMSDVAYSQQLGNIYIANQNFNTEATIFGEHINNNIEYTDPWLNISKGRIYMPLVDGYEGGIGDIHITLIFDPWLESDNTSDYSSYSEEFTIYPYNFVGYIDYDWREAYVGGITPYPNTIQITFNNSYVDGYIEYMCLVNTEWETPSAIPVEEVHKGDLIIWTGSAWDVIPSGDDILDTTTLKNEIIQEMEDYVDNAILNGAW